MCCLCRGSVSVRGHVPHRITATTVRTMPLTLVTLNIERNKHWERILPFLARVAPDVVCLQEIFERDVAKVEGLGYHAHYAHNLFHLYDPHDRASGASEGIALFSRTPFLSSDTHYYYTAPEQQRVEVRLNPEERRRYVNQSAVVATVEKDGATYTIATTHFTHAPNGTETPAQEKDLTNLLAYLARYPSLVLAGDLNLQRRGRNYERIVARYIDCIPKQYRTSIDVALHRAGKEPRAQKAFARTLVDYIFCTHHYQVSNVRQKCGLSDHCAFIADVVKRN